MFGKITSLLLVTILVVGLRNMCFAKPMIKELDPELSAGKFEGDMELTPEQLEMLLKPQKARNGLIDVRKRWPDRKVYYKIVGDFDEIHRSAIQIAINKLETSTCLRFHEAADDRMDYLAIDSKPGGCFTSVGYQGKRQEMNLQNYPIGEGCFRPGTILHEFMHALGFYHEQSSADRDDYIDVIYENITPGKEFNFKKYEPNVVTDFDVGYDYNSCLHYRAGAFSVNGEDTIVPHDRNAQIGQRVDLSKKDVDKINLMYKCPIQI